MKPMRDRLFLKMLVLLQLDFETRQFHLNETMNTFDSVPGLLAISRD